MASSYIYVIQGSQPQVWFCWLQYVGKTTYNEVVHHAECNKVSVLLQSVTAKV